MRQVTHALLTRPPLSHFFIPRKSKCFVRLACVRHAASVHPEPGSNSHVYILTEWQLAVIFPFFTVFGWVFRLVRFEILFKELSGLFYCSIVNVLCRCFSHKRLLILYHIRKCLSTTFLIYFFKFFRTLYCFCDSHIRLSHLYVLVNSFFNLFWFVLAVYSAAVSLTRQLVYITTVLLKCQHLF